MRDGAGAGAAKMERVGVTLENVFVSRVMDLMVGRGQEGKVCFRVKP